MRTFEFIMIVFTIIAMIVGLAIKDIYLLVYSGFVFVGLMLLLIRQELERNKK